MDKNRSWTVEALEAPLRLDRYLAQCMAGEPGWSRSLTGRCIKMGLVHVNGRPAADPDLKLRGGETLQLQDPKNQKPAPSEALKLKILHEDKNIMAVDKPAGLLTHPTSAIAFRVSAQWNRALEKQHESSVLDWILSHHPASSAIPRCGLVHRLDQATSGVLLIAKTKPSYFHLLKQFRNRQVKKTYTALAWNLPEEKEGVVRLPISKRYTDKGVRLTAREGTGKEAETFYRLINARRLASGHAASLLEIRPTTGRTHQIRLHLTAIGHPVCGDPVYKEKNSLQDPFRRLMLHAQSAELTMGRRKLRIESPLPADFRREMKAWWSPGKLIK